MYCLEPWLQALEAALREGVRTPGLRNAWQEVLEGGNSGEGQVVLVRGEYLPLVELHRAFDVPDARLDPTQGIIVILQAEGRRFALLVDELVGQQQVVVKNLETNYRRIHGISAATIMGDGSVALIVDVAALQRGQRSAAATIFN